jgi:hypothetical protein
MFKAIQEYSNINKHNHSLLFLLGVQISKNYLVKKIYEIKIMI